MIKQIYLKLTSCWWPAITNDIDELVKNCRNCEENRNDPKTISHPWEDAKHTFERVHIDYAGPFKGNYYFVLVDAYSK